MTSPLFEAGAPLSQLLHLVLSITQGIYENISLIPGPLEI